MEQKHHQIRPNLQIMARLQIIQGIPAILKILANKIKMEQMGQQIHKIQETEILQLRERQMSKEAIKIKQIKLKT